MSDLYKVYASQEYVNNIFANLKLELQGDLDEIGDLVGGEESGTEEVVTLIETAEYKFTSNAPEGWCATNIYLDNVPDDILSQTWKLTVGDMIEEFTMVDNPNTDSVSYVAGNGLIFGNGDTGENYIINIAIIDTESGQWGCSLFYRATAGTYPVSISYKAVE